MIAIRPGAAHLWFAAALLAPALVLAQEIPPEAATLLRQQQEGTSPGGSVGGSLPAPTGSRVEVLRSHETAPKPAVPTQDGRLQGAQREPRQGGAQPPETPRRREPLMQLPTDFQQFAATSVGELLPLFGKNLFAEPPSTFAAAEDLAPASDYLLGPGDEVVIRGWGQVEVDVRAFVSREGTISIPRVGVVPVAGTRYQDLHAAIRAAVGRLYRNFEVAVSLGRLRSIQVFVVGHAVEPGLYTVGPLSTLMNALFASGGPTPTGSMRRIELRRGEKTVGTFDLYDLLLRGDKSKDLRLQSGDVIFIPPVGPVAAIAGKVKTPAVYELGGAETPLSELVAFAGGPTTTADTRSIQLERLDRDQGRVVQELPWSPAALATGLRDGDVVLLRTVSQRFENAVTLRGNVAFPIRTEWKPGLTVSGLIPDRRVLVPEAYWEKTAARATDVRPEPRRREDAGTEEKTARIKTEVQNLLEEVNWDYAVVERLDRARLESQLLPFNLRKAVVDRDPAHDLPLQPGDIVTVFSQKDVLAPAERRTYFVRVEGEVATPGIYQVQPGETLRRLVERVGGLSKNAYLFGAEFTRESVRKEQQSRLEEVARRAERDLEQSTVQRLARAISPEDAMATRAQAESQRSAIAKMRTLKASGRMVLELDPESSKVGDLPDLMLEDGDRFFVPYRYSTVGVFGAVYNETSFIHKPGKTLDDYLTQAGGPTRSADASSIYVLRADGSVVSKRQTSWFSAFGSRELMPNDAIVVPEDYAPFSWVRELRDWSQIFYQFGLGVAAIKILL